MKKKVLIISLVLATSLNMMACGKDKEISENSPIIESTVESTEETTISENETEKTPNAEVTEKVDVVSDNDVSAGIATNKEDKKEDSSFLGNLLGSNKNDKAEKTPSPTATAKPVKDNTDDTTTSTTAPAATQKPSVSTPKPTEKPTATSKPVATEKPTVTTAPTATAKPTQAPGVVPHTCVWSSGSVTKMATCTEEGTMTYTCSVCNEVKTESIAKKDHTYTTQSTSASCEEPGYSFSVCTSCGMKGDTKTEGTAMGHDFQKIWDWGTPATCTCGAGWFTQCSRCGTVGEHGHDDPIPHTPVGQIVFDGDCTDPTIVEYRCSVCGAPCGYDEYLTEEHDWAEGHTAPYWSEEAQDFVQDTITYCTKCNIRQ